MNYVAIIGRLTRDPEVRATRNSDMMVCRMNVAVDTGYGEKKTTSYIPVVVFGKQAESCEKYLAKGRQVAVEGRIQTGSYENKEGKKVYTTDVVASRVEFIGSKSEPKEENQSQMQMPSGFMEVSDDDVPF